VSYRETETSAGPDRERAHRSHSLDESLTLLCEHSRDDNCKLVDAARAIVDGHMLLPKQPNPS
jgi:flagellar biosynthesis/type III secretory pathway ATPase